MTTIITRLYPDQLAANAARASLLSIGQNEDTIRIISGTDAVATAAAMKAARISTGAAATYAKAMTGDQALLVVQAPFNPIGTARNAIKVLQKHPAMNVGLADEDIYLREYPSIAEPSSILAKHPLVMSNPFRKLSHGHILGNNPLLASKERTSAMRGGGHMSRLFWPMKLISERKTRNSVLRDGVLFSSMLGLPLVSKAWPLRDDLPTILR